MIDDYGESRDALGRLGDHVEVAVDDAGAGFASMRHDTLQRLGIEFAQGYLYGRPERLDR